MNYTKTKNLITITNPQDFNVNQTLNCGQIFRYNIEGNKAIVYSKDKMAVLTTQNDKITIASKDIAYFENFFDLKTDYSKIKKELKKDTFLKQAVDYGYGIRILNNDAYEMIISFIISANNNISRIKKSIEYLCVNFGKNMGEYFAFPTIEELKKASVKDYEKAGLGYRSTYMFETVQNLTEKDIQNLKAMNKQDQLNFLVSLKGIGEKVANCVMLFGLNVKDVFPVDTWINKVYNHLTNSNNKNRKQITKELTERYKNLSGYAQQYFFYYYRDNKIN